MAESEPDAQERGVTTGGGCTARALITGFVLAAAVAVLTPINSILLGNSSFFGSYLPPVVVVLVAALSLGVNRLLGSARFSRRELVVILVLVLSLGGVIGGLANLLPGAMMGQAATLATAKYEDRLVTPVEPDRERAADLAAAIIERFDLDGDGRIGAGERRAMGPNLDDAAVLDHGSLTAALLRPGERYDFPTRLTVGVPERGRVDPYDPAHDHVVRAYQDGREATREAGRVGYGDRLRLRGPEGERIWWVLSGDERDVALAAGRGVVDPTASATAARLLRAQPGATLSFAGAEFELVEIDASGMPWKPWFSALLAWSPLLLGVIVAMVAIAGLVRHQWLMNERLPFPVARVLGSLTDGPRQGVWRERGLWVAMVVVLAVHAWRTAYAVGWMPIDINLQLDLTDVIPREGWLGHAPYLPFMSRLTIYFTVVAMTFLITSEVGFSMWGTFIGVNLTCALLATQGLEIERTDLQASAIGGAAVLVAVMVWVGRRHYLAVLRAAVGRDRDPVARAAAPYLWLLLTGCALMLVFMLSAGLGVAAALFVILALLLTTVVLARSVAEAGLPFVSFGNEARVDHLCMLWFGAAVPVGALVPLALIGQLLGAGDRERLLAHAVNAHAIDQEHRVGMHKVSALVGSTAVIGLLLAFVGALIAAYVGGAVTGSSWANVNLVNRSSHRIGSMLDGAGISGGQAEAMKAYLVGAVVVGVISVSRMRFPRFGLHPLGFILVAAWVTGVCWFSYFLGWLCKVLVLRYGGQQLYQRLVPVAIGLVVGEAVAIVGVMGLRLVAQLLGYDLPDVGILLGCVAASAMR